MVEEGFVVELLDSELNRISMIWLLLDFSFTSKETEEGFFFLLFQVKNMMKVLSLDVLLFSV